MIILFTGRPGAGKTYSAVQYIRKYYYKQGHDIVSNIALDYDYSPSDSTVHNYGSLESALSDIYNSKITQGDLEDNKTCIFFDEIHMYVNSREWKSLDMQMKHMLTQHRKYGIDLIGTAQNIDMIDKYVRDINQYWYYCKNLANICTVATQYVYLDDPDRENPIPPPKVYPFTNKGFNRYNTFEVVEPPQD